MFSSGSRHGDVNSGNTSEVMFMVPSQMPYARSWISLSPVFVTALMFAAVSSAVAAEEELAGEEIPRRSMCGLPW